MILQDKGSENEIYLMLMVAIRKEIAFYAWPLFRVEIAGNSTQLYLPLSRL
jgi:hypothetical protein